MKRLSQERMANLVKKSRDTLGLSQEELSSKTGMNRQMIGRLERKEYIPSISQLENLANVLDFDIASLFEESDPLVYTAFRSSNMSQEEQVSVNHMFEMMMASKQQILLRKALLHE